jgi:hypothetical protein
MKILKGKDFKYFKFTIENIDYDNIKLSVCAHFLDHLKVEVPLIFSEQGLFRDIGGEVGASLSDKGVRNLDGGWRERGNWIGRKMDGMQNNERTRSCDMYHSGDMIVHTREMSPA